MVRRAPQCRERAKLRQWWEAYRRKEKRKEKLQIKLTRAYYVQLNIDMGQGWRNTPQAFDGFMKEKIEYDEEHRMYFFEPGQFDEVDVTIEKYGMSEAYSNLRKFLLKQFVEELETLHEAEESLYKFSRPSSPRNDGWD